MKIKIADITLNLGIKDKLLKKAASERYKSFIAGSKPAYDILIESKNYGIKLKHGTSFIHKKIYIYQKNYFGILDIVKKKGIAFIPNNIYYMDSFLRILYSTLLILNRGMLIHGCGIRGGGATLFSGVSSSGKTTIARYFNKKDVLSDEVVALRKNSNGWYAYSTPFWGEMESGRTRIKEKLNAVYMLKRGSLPKIEQLDVQQAFRRTFRNLLFFMKSGIGGDCINTVSDLCRQVPCYNFYFSPLRINRRILDEIIK